MLRMHPSSALDAERIIHQPDFNVRYWLKSTAPGKKSWSTETFICGLCQKLYLKKLQSNCNKLHSPTNTAFESIVIVSQYPVAIYFTFAILTHKYYVQPAKCILLVHIRTFCDTALIVLVETRRYTFRSEIAHMVLGITQN